MTDLFDPPKEFRRGETIYSKDFNDTNFAITASFRKLGSERTDMPFGVQNVFGVDTPYEDQHAATKGYVDAQIEEVDNKVIIGPTGATGPQGAPGAAGTDGENIAITGTVSNIYYLLELAEDPDNGLEIGDVYITLDTDICYVWTSDVDLSELDLGIQDWFVDIGVFGGGEGPEGPEGPIGPIGPEGYPGLDGTNGPAGPQGFQGPRGYTGQTGATGQAGPGYYGPTVESGTDGETLFWNKGGWQASDALKYTIYGLQAEYMGKAKPSFVVANEVGLLNSLLVPTSFEGMDKTFADLHETIGKLTKRLADLEDKS